MAVNNRWKCIVKADGTAMLFDIHETFGIAEKNDVADQNPDVLAHISDYLTSNKITNRYVCVPEE